MERPSNIEDSGDGASSKDDLGALIRWSFADSLSEAGPPADVWPKILAQVKEMDAPIKPQRRRRHATLPLASFVQAAVISILLLAFGLEVERNAFLAHSSYSADATPTIPRVSVPQETYQDMLRGHMLLQKEKERSLRSPHGEYFAETQKPWGAGHLPDFDK